MNQLTHRSPPGTIMEQSNLLDNVPADWDDLSSGVAVSFPILGIKGGKWHYRFKGEDTIISDARGFAVPAINVVILKAQKELSRTLYPPGSYVEGANNRPICWSSDGVRPDDLVEEPVNPVCATCPKAAWGSGATPAAPKAQACQQRRRVVVVPYSDDLSNVDGGGPVLLSVPPSSLRNLDSYSGLLKDARLHYFGCITQLSFDQDPNLAFPRIEFSWVQKLTDDEAAQVLNMRNTDTVSRILVSKINVDGPEVADGVSDVSSGAPRGAVQPGVKAATQPVIPRQAQQSMAEPQVAAEKVIIPAAAQTVKPRVGGFAATPVQAGSPIATAMAKPAAKPPTTRVVKTPADPSTEEMAVEQGDVSRMPDELTSAFASLMKKQ